jgi:Putative peptidoglycan binding domain
MKIVTKFALFAVVALALVAGASSADAAFTRYLTIGSTGSDVVELQTILEAQGYLVMPAGVAKGYFGALTKNAVMKWQAAVGLPSTGYFGPMSIAAIGSVSGGNNNNNGGNMGSGNDNSGSDNDLQGGDGDFRDFDVLGNPDNEDVEEGETVEVFGFEFEADDSDLLVERVDVVASSTNANVEKPWKVLDEVALVVDGDEVATVDASDEDNWDELSGLLEGNYRVRFEDVDWKVEEGDEVKAYVSVTASDDLDNDELGDWDISLDDDGVRARNAEGIDVYEGDIDDVTSFDIQVAEEGDLTVTVDSNDNEDQEVEVSEDDTTDDVLLYTAEVESEDGDNEIDEVTVTIATTSAVGVGGANFDDMIDTLYLFIDGEEVGSESVDANDPTVVFDDIDDVTIEEDEEVVFEVRADINEQGEDEENYNDGDGVYVDALDIDFVDNQDDDQTESEGTNGGNITFSVNALAVDLDTKSAGQYGNIETQGEYFITFDVTAPEEEDIYIPIGAASSTATNTGAFYMIFRSDNQQITGSSTLGTTLASATSTLAELLLGDEDGNNEGSATDEGNGYYKISSGNTGKFTLHVIIDNNGVAARGLKVQLSGLDYNTLAQAAGLTRFTSGLDEDYRTSSVLLQQIDAQ